MHTKIKITYQEVDGGADIAARRHGHQGGVEQGPILHDQMVVAHIHLKYFHITICNDDIDDAVTSTYITYIHTYIYIHPSTTKNKNNKQVCIGVHC